MNLALARHNMIEQQIRPWDVLDQRVLELIATTPRDEFVPPAYAALAYADINIPLRHGQFMMAPKVEAKLVQALDIHPRDTILEVGTGSAYLTALLAKSGRQVHTVDIYPDFAEEAKRKLDLHGIDNVTLETGDAAKGWDKGAPYNIIAITGSLPLLPESLQQFLAPGGRLFAIVGEAPAMEAVLITRTSHEGWIRESLFETEIPPLVNASAPTRFIF